MVAKKGSRIARNPKEKEIIAEADEWINQGGIDPETVIPSEAPTPTPPEPTQENNDDQARKFPHRISFDMSKEQYKRLKWASFDGDRSMNEILREAAEEWMKARNY